MVDRAIVGNISDEASSPIIFRIRRYRQTVFGVTFLILCATEPRFSSYCPILRLVDLNQGRTASFGNPEKTSHCSQCGYLIPGSPVRGLDRNAVGRSRSLAQIPIDA